MHFHFQKYHFEILEFVNYPILGKKFITCITENYCGKSQPPAMSGVAVAEESENMATKLEKLTKEWKDKVAARPEMRLGPGVMNIVQRCNIRHYTLFYIYVLKIDIICIIFHF